MNHGWIVGRKKIACYCDIHPDTLARWMKQYPMPIIKVGGRWCADPATLDKWLIHPHEKRQIKNTPSLP